MRTIFSVVALLLSSTVTAQPMRLTRTAPPEGMRLETWQDIWDRSQKVGKAAARLVSGANADCIAASALDVLAWAQVDVSSDARRNPEDASLESVKKGKGSKVRQAVRRHRDDTCRGNGGPPGGATASDLEALLKWTSDRNGWMTSDPDAWRATADAIRAAFAAGIGVGADMAESAAQMLPIVNPCAVAPRLSICAKGQSETL